MFIFVFQTTPYRYYDYAVPGFTTPDPLAEKHYSESPYSYCGGNPINRVDPTGLDWYGDIDVSKDNIKLKWRNYYSYPFAIIDNDYYAWLGRIIVFSIIDNAGKKTFYRGGSDGNLMKMSGKFPDLQSDEAVQAVVKEFVNNKNLYSVEYSKFIFFHLKSADYELTGKFKQHFKSDLYSLIPSKLFAPTEFLTVENLDISNIQAPDFSSKGSAETNAGNESASGSASESG